MKTEIRNSISGLLLIPLVLACFAVLPSVQAAPDPPPPPGVGNTADGAGAMANVTTGMFNSALGKLKLPAHVLSMPDGTQRETTFKEAEQLITGHFPRCERSP
jgi:hypothetical protein